MQVDPAHLQKMSSNIMKTHSFPGSDTLVIEVCLCLTECYFKNSFFQSVLVLIQVLTKN